MFFSRWGGIFAVSVGSRSSDLKLFGSLPFSMLFVLLRNFLQILVAYVFSSAEVEFLLLVSVFEARILNFSDRFRFRFAGMYVIDISLKAVLRKCDEFWLTSSCFCRKCRIFWPGFYEGCSTRGSRHNFWRPTYGRRPLAFRVCWQFRQIWIFCHGKDCQLVLVNHRYSLNEVLLNHNWMIVYFELKLSVVWGHGCAGLGWKL